MLNDADEALTHIATEIGSIKAVVASFPAYSTDDDEIVINTSSDTFTIPTLRQQANVDGEYCLALADFIGRQNEYLPTDHIGLFAVSGGMGMQQLIEKIADADEYKGLIYRTVADRLAEAATEATHRQALIDWHYTDIKFSIPDANLNSIRPAVGYPSLPDQSLVFILDNILDFSKISML